MNTLISVVINTLNEEKNLPYALRSVQAWVDEIIVVDMYSDDRTVEIAKEYGAKIYFHERMGFADPARSFAISRATLDWILILDADEIVPPALSRKLIEIANSQNVDIVNIPYVNYMFGKPLMYSGWGPTQDKHMRFFKAGYLDSTHTVHDFLIPAPEARILNLPYQEGCGIIHFNYSDIAHFLEKLNRYTSIEARQAMDRQEQVSDFKALVSAARGFMRRFFKLKGYRDGWRGFYLALFWAFYRIAIYAKLRQMETVGSRDVIEENYRAEAERFLEEYSIFPPIHIAAIMPIRM